MIELAAIIGLTLTNIATLFGAYKLLAQVADANRVYPVAKTNKKAKAHVPTPSLVPLEQASPDNIMRSLAEQTGRLGEYTAFEDEA